MKLYQYFVYILLIHIINGLMCGGNCPTGNCPLCLCGSQTNKLDIASWCSKYTWNQSCCKCIISHGSNSNANYIQYDSSSMNYAAGLWSIPDQIFSLCNSGQPPCDPNQNLNCAKYLYGVGGNSFHYWKNAGVCGC